MNEQQEHGIERLFVEFAEECNKNPNLKQAAQEMREGVFEAAESAGVNPSHAFGVIIRDMMILESLQKRVEESRNALTAGKLPAFVIEEAREQQ
ncbi:hypothetical protein [Akkermansia muciniphila]|uniref:hypothetical protein n=1 Tax=Akkermansia muciniphila TaxID=239935 RepID=UPI00201E0530|nr:hypothetical protein [Akkermansia muciniphila]MCL6681582.1 hypothetical protein [Akkermansia muciniphila]